MLNIYAYTLSVGLDYNMHNNIYYYVYYYEYIINFVCFTKTKINIRYIIIFCYFSDNKLKGNLNIKILHNIRGNYKYNEEVLFCFFKDHTFIDLRVPP